MRIARPKPPLVRPGTVIFIIITGLAILIGLASTQALPPLTAQSPPASSTAPVMTSSSGEAAAKTLCVGCHKLPPPQSLPRLVWRDQIARMWLILQNQPEPVVQGAAARTVTLSADWDAIARYYESAAPEKLGAPPAWPPPDGRLAFRRRTLATEPRTPDPAISNVRLVDLDGDKKLEIVAGDLRHGHILAGSPLDPRGVVREVSYVPHPAHIEPIDFDGDGVLDLLVGDLGAFMPSDHDRGTVVWLRGRKEGTYSQMGLDKWPPVADVRAADFDGDGKRDLAVAAFGWRRTGLFSVLKNDTIDYDNPAFVPIPVEQRTGAIHAVPADLNTDGQMDVIVLFSQEHEMVAAFLNRGAMRFDRQVIYQAPHPAWGSSGLDVVDLDRDGDLDVLVTNGDSFESSLPKPYHGIIWLENRGAYPFTEHALGKLGGVHRAQVADMDGDGDLDVVASALVGQQPADTSQLPSIVWLEQTPGGGFEPHTIKVGRPTHATLDLGDIESDGDIDIVVGVFSSGEPTDGSLEVWENVGVK